MKSPNELKLAYSGPKSVKFWKRINALPAADREGLYLCGCLLQNMEHSVMRWLELAEEKAKAPP